MGPGIQLHRHTRDTVKPGVTAFQYRVTPQHYVAVPALWDQTHPTIFTNITKECRRENVERLRIEPHRHRVVIGVNKAVWQTQAVGTI